MRDVVKNNLLKCFWGIFLFGSILSAQQKNSLISYREIVLIEKERVLNAANKYLLEDPITVTAVKATRSVGGIHDYYSEGTYWWPDPNNPDGPYIRRDGLINPNNFDAHLKALIRFSIQTAALTAAFKITGEEKYLRHALKHIKAWFVDEKTKMNPNFLYAQAIKGVVTGRGIGLIDAIHFIEVARSVEILEEMNAIDNENLRKIKDWFSDFLSWITTHQYGIEERENGNNHSSWWAAQVAMYARLVNDSPMLSFCKEFFKSQILEKQMALDGSFPVELSRTRPYNYSLFNIEAFGTIAQIINDSTFWNYSTSSHKNLKIGFEFIYPFIENKSNWTFKKDVVCFDELPVRIQSLLFAGLAFNEEKYIKLWKKLNADYTDEELIRTFPIRQPILWIEDE